MGQTPGEIRRDIEHTRERMSYLLDAIGYKFDVPARVRYRLWTVKDSVGHFFGGNGHDVGTVGREGVEAWADASQERLSMVQERAGAVVHETEERLESAVHAVEERAGEIKTDIETGLSHVKENVMENMTTAAEATLDTVERQGRAVGSFAKDNALLLGIGAFAATLAAGLLLPRTRVEQQRIQPYASKVTHKAVQAGEEALHKGQEKAKEALEGVGQQSQGQQSQSEQGQSEQGQQTQEQRPGQPAMGEQKQPQHASVFPGQNRPPDNR